MAAPKSGIETKWHAFSSEASLRAIGSSHSGLSQKEAESRLVHHGPNELIEKKKKGDIALFLDQFKSFLIGILLVAIIISFAVGELLDTFVISIIVLLNVILGYVQTKKAEEAIAALKRMAVPTVKVFREGQAKNISSRLIVPGDIIILAAGDRIPADCRIMKQMNLKVDESILTGESVPVVKHEGTIKGDVALHSRRNMIYSGTTLVYGRCEAVVVSTGMSTEFGKIAETLQAPEDETPLQKKLDAFGKFLGYVFVAVCGVIFLLGVLRGTPLFEMFITALALAVAAVPEGLLASITIALTFWISKMASKRAIIRRLTAVEGLGSVTVICSDKTGTLTVNEMTVKRVWTFEREMSVTGEGYDSGGDFLSGSKKMDVSRFPDVQKALKAGLLCNDAFSGREHVGDPTELALLVSARKAGIHDSRGSIKRIGEVPFDSERKMMSVLYETKDSDARSVWAKGAAESILKRCSFIMKGSRKVRLTTSDRKKVLEVNKKYASESFRVLAFAIKKVNSGDGITENELVFLGLQAMMDPPRPEVKASIQQCKAAGIKVIMVTGDHKETAVAVAKELGLIDEGSVITGDELEAMTDKQFDQHVGNITVYARVSPAHKVRITEALKRSGHIVAMTGDGVNDAPALKMADVGVAMGRTGTDVTREVADMVISDDNFATIVSAVEEGRGIYDNIRKTIAFLLSGNIAEVGVLLFAVLIGLPLPLAAAQILWINLVTDGLPALALSVDPVTKDVMSRPPRRKDEKLTDGMRAYIVDYPILLVASCLLLFVLSLNAGNDLIKSQTIVFTTIVLFELFQSFSCRSLERPVELFDNKYLLIAALIAISAQLLIMYVEPMQSMFKVAPLGVVEWVGIIFVSLVGFIYLEISKAMSSKKMAAVPVI